MNKKSLPLILFFVVSSFLVSALLVFSFSFFEIWELKAQDQLFNLRYSWNKPSLSPHVVHVDLDGRTLRELDPSVSSVQLLSRVITTLQRVGVAGIGIDMLLPRCSDESACGDLVEAVRKGRRTTVPVVLKPRLDGDSAPFQQELGRQDLLPPGFLWKPRADREGEVIVGDIADNTFPALARAARGVGHITCYPDVDGTFRRFPLLLRNGDGYVPSLNLSMICSFLQVEPQTVRVLFGKDILLPQAHFPDGRVKDISIPIDRQGKMLINFPAPWGKAYSHYSIAAILKAEQDDDALEALFDELEDSLVLVADVSTGSRDVGPTPLEGLRPLVGLHSTIIDNIISENFLRALDLKEKIFVDLILLLLLTTLAYRFSGMLFVALFGGLAGCWFGTSLWLFLTQGIVSDFVRPSFALFLSFLLIQGSFLLREEKERSTLRARFENYFSPELLDKIMVSPSVLEVCEHKELTILFSDIVGFTAWSADKEPARVHAALNEYFEIMAEIVFRYDGTIDKYIGDGLLAFFGDPVEHKDHALRAVQAALEMQHSAAELRRKWKKEDGMPLQIRVGLNTGEVLVGNMGSEKRVDYTVIGANVNLASRLESNARPGTVTISETTCQAVRGRVDVIERGTVDCKGFPTPVEVFEVLG